MTGLGKYEKGLELEAEGMTPSEVAMRLGFTSTQGWHSHKAYYKKKQEAFNARAAGRPAEHPETQNFVVSNENDEPVGFLTLDVTYRLEARSELFEYAYENGVLSIFRQETPQPFTLRREDWEKFKGEVEQLLSWNAGLRK